MAEFKGLRSPIRFHAMIAAALLASVAALAQEAPKPSVSAPADSDPCKLEIGKDELIGKLPGADPAPSDRLSLIRARAKSRLEFAAGSQVPVSIVPKVFAAGQMIEPKDMDRALKGLAKGNESLQFCRVSLAMSDRKQGESVDLSALKIRPAGTIHTATEYSVTLGGKTFSRFKNARARSMWGPSRDEPFFRLTVDCENYKGDEALTYRTIEAALGFKLSYYAEGSDAECRPAIDTSQALSRAVKIAPLVPATDTARVTERVNKTILAPVRTESSGTDRGKASRAE